MARIYYFSAKLAFFSFSWMFTLVNGGLFSGQNRSTIEQLTLDSEFSKDVASLMTEANVESNCDGNVFITTKGCSDYLDYMLAQLSEWAPPVILVTYQNSKDIGNPELWTKFLASEKRPCSIVFVCDLMRSAEDLSMDTTIVGDGAALGTLTTPEEEIGHLKLPKFIESSDQILYLSNFLDTLEDSMNESGGNNTEMAGEDEIQAKILKQTGILLQINVKNQSDAEPESLMHVYSVCEYCGGRSKLQQKDLGYWRRNKTIFGKYFHIFDEFHKLSFNSTNLSIGFFNHQPHFSCFFDETFHNQDLALEVMDNETYEDEPTLQELSTTCEGVEWEMISQMGKSLDFTTTWINFSNPEGGGEIGETSNISNMIASFEEGKIDLAVGGISVTPKRIMYVDFSSVFANDPIVFVVEKKSELFALGIWLAFNPEIWPLMLLIITIISFLFHIIIYQYTLEQPTETTKSQPKWALSTFLQRQYKEEVRKPIHVSMFEALEVTLQPLLGQPLSATQITHRPRRLLKLLLIIWWFSCLIITTLYNTSFITSLINPISPKEPESLQYLLDFGHRFKPAGKQGAFFELVKSVIDTLPSDDDEDTEIYSEELLNGASKEERNTVSLFKKISDRLITDGSGSPSLIAYVIEESAVKGIKWDKKEIGFSQIKVIRERLFLTTYAWPTQRHAPFKKKIDTALAKLKSAGLVEYWYQQFGDRDNKELRSAQFLLREKLRQINLNLQVLQGVFIFLIFGHGFGALVLGLEHLTKRYKFRFFTRQEIKYLYRKMSTHLKKLYTKYFAAQHEQLQLRRKKNKMRFRGAVRTVTTFRKREVDIPYLK